jgi:hypothetical protein
MYRYIYIYEREREMRKQIGAQREEPEKQRRS